MTGEAREARFFFSLTETLCATAVISVLVVGVAGMDAANPYVWGSLGLSLAYGIMLCVFVYFGQHVLAGVAAFVAVGLAMAFVPTVAVPTLVNAKATLPFLCIAYLSPNSRLG